MTGHGQFGPLEMGGMFSVVKVREGLARDDYTDPGWYRHPPGTVAYEYTGQDLPDARGAAPARSDGTASSSAPAAGEVTVSARKPRSHGHH